MPLSYIGTLAYPLLQYVRSLANCKVEGDIKDQLQLQQIRAKSRRKKRGLQSKFAGCEKIATCTACLKDIVYLRRLLLGHETVLVLGLEGITVVGRCLHYTCPQEVS